VRLLLLSADDFRAALPMPAAIEAMKEAFAALATGRAHAPERVAVEQPGTDDVALLMGASVEGLGLAAKVVSFFPGNAARGAPVVQGLALVLDPETGAPRALLDGAALTAWRTGAASGAATDLLARPDARVAAVFGAGAQARTQVLAVDAARELAELRVVARRPERAEALAAELRASVRAPLRVMGSPEGALRGAHVVCTATSARAPLFPADLVEPGAHVNAVGSFRPDMRELDPALCRDARVFVDARTAARREAGELLAALEAGHTRVDDWTELGAVAAGLAPGRRSPDERTLFKSVGLAVQDAVAGARALECARELGLGRAVEL
jgi:ornithine cyclodeaminase